MLLVPLASVVLEFIVRELAAHILQHLQIHRVDEEATPPKAMSVLSSLPSFCPSFPHLMLLRERLVCKVPAHGLQCLPSRGRGCQRRECLGRGRSFEPSHHMHHLVVVVFCLQVDGASGSSLFEEQEE